MEADTELEGKRIALLAENNYHELELWYPLLRMREAGASVVVVGMPGVEEYRSKLGLAVKVTRPPKRSRPTILTRSSCPAAMRRT